MFPSSHQRGLTPLMATLRKPIEEQKELGISSEALTECAAVFLHHERTRVDVQEPVSVLRHVCSLFIHVYSSRGEIPNCVCPRHPMIPLVIVAACDGQ